MTKEKEFNEEASAGNYLLLKGEKEFNLSEKIFDSQYYEEHQKLFVKDVKTFIKKDTELINQFACGNITLLELKQKREELAGGKLI